MGRRAAAALAASLLASVGTLPAAVRAADDEALVLPRQTAAAVTIDLDGDGAREVVRIAEADADVADAGIDLVVEAWSLTGDGWSMVASTPLARPAPGGQTVEVVVPIDVVTDGFGLLTWRVDGHERALVVTGVGPDRRGGATNTVCCVVVAEVSIGSDGMRLGVLDGFDGFAESVLAVDMDADGTDELVMSGPGSRDSQAHATVLRWTGSGFTGDRVAVGWGEFGAHPTLVGDTDDTPGDEVVYGPADDGSLVRLTAVDGALVVDTASGFGRGTGSYPWFFGAGDGRVFARLPSTLSAWRWPRGGELELVGRVGTPDSAHVRVMITDDEAALVQSAYPYLPGAHAAVRIHRSDLGTRTEADASRAVAALADVYASAVQPRMRSFPIVEPYMGPIPGGLPDGRAAYVSMGNLITLDHSGGVAVEPIGAMAGVYPIGLAGPDGEWMAVSRSPATIGWPVFLYASGGLFGTDLAIVRTATVFQPEAGDGVAMDALGIASVGVAEGKGERWVSGPDGITVSVSGPAGSTVTAYVDETEVFDDVVEDEPIQIALRPTRRGQLDYEYKVSIVLVTSDGHAYATAWDITALREEPELAATAETRLGAQAATVRGRSSEHATVLVDGNAASLETDGSFAVDVGAGLWPRDIEVVARDPVGNETAVQLTVVGVFDYRGLPWALVVAAVTLMCGLWLFLRAPHVRPAPASVEGDGQFEELDADSSGSAGDAWQREGPPPAGPHG